MKYLIVLCFTFLITSCLVDPVDLENDVDCTSTSFDGHWKYYSTNGVVLDSISDIEIIETDDKSRGDLLIDGRYFDIKSYVPQGKWQV